MSFIDYNNIYRGAFENHNYCNVPDTEFRWQYCKDYIKALGPLPYSVADIGAGRGNLINILRKELPLLQILAIDVGTFHSISVPHLTVNLASTFGIEMIRQLSVDIITCVDVLEHLEEATIERAIEAMATACRHAIITVANHSDHQNGVELHLTQRESAWWTALFEKWFTILDHSTHYAGRLYAYRLIARQTA